MSVLDTFFTKLWQQYSVISPQAVDIHQLFERRGEELVNDHVAFRTFADSHIGIDILEDEVLALGYRHLDSYQFDVKKLDARCYVHDKSPTKIFISELRWQSLSDASQVIIQDIIEQAKATLKSPLLEQSSRGLIPLLSAGRLWQLPSYADYQTLASESEYAAWLSVWGLRANHFTIFVNHLKSTPELTDVVALLQQQGYQLNEAGGVIKGAPSDLLIQASTMADTCIVNFNDAGEQAISSCYYEFAQRFNQENGALYQGFVPLSADKIFESTNMKSILGSTTPDNEN
ncbi:DUF1338 domain-containing protein [Moritella sp.]|uniref:DUF1338 domain-containing protein n=1 Tax=Moritella sp. TaxID=78556 RepID=UPI001D289996|nr:DUF1338 domain-containing protein [Moritella sp.]MCJ8351287.1 DUF1338 domain-containing protein [Moritella sp.]NQZ41310.1 DUF1338 domain-containing protein [Moritella sp.]